MSSALQINRLFALITRQWISVGKIYLMSLGIAAGIIAAFYGYALYDLHNALAASNYVPMGLLDFRVSLFVFLGLFFVTIISGTYFSDYGQKAKAIFEVLIPASRVEKFLTAIFYTVVLCLLSYIAVFLLIDGVFLVFMRKRVASSPSIHADEIRNLGHTLSYFAMVFNRNELFRYFYFLPFLFNAIFLLGSIAFRSFQYIKTAVSMIVYIALWCFGTVYIMKTLTDGSVSVRQDSFWQQEHHIFQVLLAAGVVITLIFWGIAFLRLKEKEV